jgi:hypothetical protein
MLEKMGFAIDTSRGDPYAARKQLK